MATTKPPDGYVSVPEAQQRLGIARQRLYQLLDMRRIDHKRTPDGRIWVSIKAIEKRLAGTKRLASGQCVSTREVADFFGVDTKTVRDWSLDGLLKSTKIHNRLCFSPSEIIAFVPPNHGGLGRPPSRKATRTLRGRKYPPPA